MIARLVAIAVGALFSLTLAGSVLADEVKGKITKVGGGGREITVKAKDKEVTVKISSSRTSLEGVGDRSELKEGQNVTVDYSGDEAKKIKVIK